MVKLSEKASQKPRQTESWVTCTKQLAKSWIPRKALKEIKNAAAVNAEMVREQNSLIADMEKVLVAPIEDQTSYSIPLTHYPSCRGRPWLFSSVKAERGEEAAEEKSEATGVGSWSLRKEAIFTA